MDTPANGQGKAPDPAASQVDKPQARPDKLRELSKLLEQPGNPQEGAPDDSQANDSPEPGQDGQPGKAKPAKPLKTLEDAAERLGLEVAELYKLAIPTGLKEGESLSIAELKDANKARGDFAVKELQFEEKRLEREQELMRAEGELQELLQHLPKEVLKPENLKAARARLEARAAKQRELTLKAIPDWQNGDTRKAELGEMVEHLKSYGFPPSYLQTVTDHRTLLYIRENWKREKRLRSALALIEEKGGKPHGTGKGNGSPPNRPAGKPPSSRDTRGTRRDTLINLMKGTKSP